jgi:hypothetical protein
MYHYDVKETHDYSIEMIYNVKRDDIKIPHNFKDYEMLSFYRYICSV